MSKKKRRQKKSKQETSGAPPAGQSAPSETDKSGWIANLVVGVALLLIGPLFGVLGVLKEWRIVIGLSAAGLTLLCWVAVSLWCRRRKPLVFTLVSAIVWICAIYWILHPPFVESEVHGLLLPADERAPTNNCPYVPSNAVLLLLGNMPVYATVFPHRVIGVDQDEVLLSIDRNENGIAVSGRLFSEDGKLVAEIINNEFYLNPSNFFRRARADKHTLIVYNLGGEEVLNVRYMNKNTIRLFAHFRHPSGAEVRITKDGVDATEPSMIPGHPELKLGQHYHRTECRIDAKLDIPLHTHKEAHRLFNERDEIEKIRDPELKKKAKKDWDRKFQEFLKRQVRGEW